MSIEIQLRVGAEVACIQLVDDEGAIFPARLEHELWVSPYNQHPNARAHAMAAESLRPFVAGLLKSATAASPSTP